MKKIFILLLIVILLIIIGGYYWYLKNFPLAPPIELPQINNIEKVEIYNGIDTFIITNEESIIEFVEYFNNAKPTRIMSVNETPNKKTYFEVQFKSTNGKDYKSYVYNENNKWLLEQSYHGVYIVDEGIKEFLLSFSSK